MQNEGYSSDEDEVNETTTKLDLAEHSSVIALSRHELMNEHDNLWLRDARRFIQIR